MKRATQTKLDLLSEPELIFFIRVKRHANKNSNFAKAIKILIKKITNIYRSITKHKTPTLNPFLEQKKLYFVNWIEFYLMNLRTN